MELQCHIFTPEQREGDEEEEGRNETKKRMQQASASDRQQQRLQLHFLSITAFPERQRKPQAGL